MIDHKINKVWCRDFGWNVDKAYDRVLQKQAKGVKLCTLNLLPSEEYASHDNCNLMRKEIGVA